MTSLYQKAILTLLSVSFTSMPTASKPVQHTPQLVVLQLQFQLQFMGSCRILFDCCFRYYSFGLFVLNLDLRQFVQLTLQ